MQNHRCRANKLSDTSCEAVSLNKLPSSTDLKQQKKKQNKKQKQKNLRLKCSSRQFKTEIPCKTIHHLKLNFWQKVTELFFLKNSLQTVEIAEISGRFFL